MFLSVPIEKDKFERSINSLVKIELRWEINGSYLFSRQL